MNQNHAFIPNPRGVVGEVFEDEIILVNLKEGIYYSLRDTAAFIWKIIAQPMTISQITTQLRASYQVKIAGTKKTTTIETDVQTFIEMLLAEALIVSAPPSDVPQMWAQVEPPVPYQPPVVERYTDMQELLLVDPVHEVDAEYGWPLKK